MTESEGMKTPAAFTWRDERYEVAETTLFWFDTGFGAQERGKAWYTRRHRNYYQVRTTSGHLFQLYLDRSGGRREWILHKRIKSNTG